MDVNKIHVKFEFENVSVGCSTRKYLFYSSFAWNNLAIIFFNFRYWFCIFFFFFIFIIWFRIRRQLRIHLFNSFDFYNTTKMANWNLNNTKKFIKFIQHVRLFKYKCMIAIMVRLTGADESAAFSLANLISQSATLAAIVISSI